MSDNPNELLEHVLRGLGDVKPSSGLEDRVLARLRTRTTLTSPWHQPFRRRSPVAFPAWGMAAAAIAVIAMAAAFYHRHQAATAGTAQVSPAPQTVLKAMPVMANASRSYAATTTPTVSHDGQSSAHLQRTSATTHRAVPCDCDSLAMQEWHAPSQPAPELPLTHEERLLQGLAYRGNTEQLAALTPLFRAAEQAREQAEFQHFFTKPTNGDNE